MFASHVRLAERLLPRRVGAKSGVSVLVLASAVLKRRHVADHTIVAEGRGILHSNFLGTVEESDHGLKCSVLTAAHQGVNALPLSGGDWPVVVVVLLSLLFQS